LVPDPLVKELTTLHLGERRHSWVQNPKGDAPERVEVKKQFLAVTRQASVVGFLVACWEVRHSLGVTVVKGMEEWQHYFFSDFNEAVEAFAYNEVPTDCR
jgi:hypothetical protein